MYSIATLDGNKAFKKAKGVPKTYVKNVRHDTSASSALFWGSLLLPREGGKVVKTLIFRCVYC